MNRDFLAGWTNLVGNARVKELIYDKGYPTIAYTADGQFVVNPMVVKGLLIETNEDQSKTYTLRLHENLKFSDGTPITAKDFIFDSMWAASPYMIELDAQTFTGSEANRGAVDYNRGNTDVYEGLRLIGDYEFSITIDYETIYYDEDGNEEGRDVNFPFWFQLTYANFAPSPMHVIAPGCDIQDTGAGCKITGPWGVDLLRRTVDNGSSGYRYTPTVGSGPYKFISYNAGDNIALLEVNEHFLGDDEGYKPMIKNIVVKMVESAVRVEEFITGGIDILVQTGGATTINALLDFADEGNANYFNFPRYGYGKVTFHVSQGPTQFAEVRRAVAYCFDREEACRIWTGGYGVVVHSRMGLAQWMYGNNQEYVDSLMNTYAVNVDKAIEELVAGGWTLDASGNPYTSGIRYKKMPDGSLMQLHLEWFAANDTIGVMVEQLIADNLAQAGISYNYFFSSDSETFSNAIYGRGETYYHMVTSATGFAIMDSPWYYYDPDPATWGDWNSNFTSDDYLYSLVMDMKATEAGDTEAYFEKWLKFVIYFNEQAYDLPFYSDLYHDFFIKNLKNYYHSATYPYTSALVRAWLD